MRIEKYDYSYDLTDEQLQYYSALPAIAKLRWLDQARRFTLLARKAQVVESRTHASRGEDMAQNPTEQKVRRIVTGHDAQGRSAIVSDTTTVMEGVLHELWATHGTPARFGGTPHLGSLPVDLEPPKAGTVVRFVRLQPSEGASREELEQGYSMAFAAIKASHTRVDTRRHPAMHKTRTVDYGILLSGRVKLLMDEGERELRPFDVVIQRGTNHGWVNPGPEPALMMFVLIDATE